MTTEQATDPDDLCDIAQQHHEAGRLTEAEALYQNILQIDPGHPGALYFLGGIAYEDGRNAFATELMERLLADNPTDIEALHLAGLIAAKNALPTRALDLIQRALTLQPQYAQAHYSLGDLLQTQQRFDEALASYRRALDSNPQYAEAHCHIGHLLQHKNQLPEAIDHYRRALALKANLPAAHGGLGQILQAQQQFAAAAASFRQALALKPDGAEYHNGLGTALLAQGDIDGAIASYRSALALTPDAAEAHNNLGVALLANGAASAAVESFRQALALKPDDIKKLLNFSQALIDANQLAAAADCLRRVLALDPQQVTAFSSLLAVLQYLPDYSPQQLFDDHVAFGARFEAPLRARWPQHINSREPLRRLKVGFVSGDFNTHPVGFFLENALRHIDRRHIDITLYPTNAIVDALTERLRALAATWTPLGGLSDDVAAQQIQADAIDILVDLCGHTKDNRLLLFARKPAPVQVAWLGYWATTGLRAIDYILCDRSGIPASEARFYVEQPWYLPATRLCFTPPTETLSIGELPALTQPGITFGCFNNLTKMTDAVVAVWARVLRAVPNARLLLKSKQLDDTGLRETVSARFAAHGIGAERLLLEGHSPRAEYFSAYRRVDIALDPFPFTGGTTTIEGLWMGVPVITRRGDRLIAHQGESILHALGLLDWVAADDDAYVTLAVARAADLEALARLRASLRERLLASPLCDGLGFARDLVQAFKAMWLAYCNRQPPHN